VADEKPEQYTIWHGFTTFRKNGTPIMGTLGASAKPVVIMESETFQRLVREHPSLATVVFRMMEI
jgi:hypothetical protein